MKRPFKILLSLLFLLPVCSYGQTDIDYPVINDETWTAAGSPYLIKNSIEIQSLIIEPGVTIAFTGNFEFRVTGTFIAAGTKSDSILFQNDAGFTGNWGGILIENTAAIDTLRYVRISQASPAGITVQNNATYIEHGQILRNNGDGLISENGNAVLLRTVISENANHGVAVISSGEITLKAVEIVSNGNKGIRLNNGKATLENLVISRNTNGGIDLESLQDTLNFGNIVIADNEFAYAIDAKNGSITGRNSIFYFNRSTPINPGSADITISYSNIENGFSGAGNFSSDPLFSSDHNYTLQPGSPCIDRGDPDPAFNDRCFPPSLDSLRNDVGAYGGPGACEWLEPLSAYPDTIDFGTVTAGIPEDTTIKIQNSRNFPLSILDISLTGPDAGAFAADTAAFGLGPYEAKPIAVQFDPSEERGYNADLEIKSTGGDFTVTLKGSGKYAIFDLDRTSLNFETVNVGESASEKVYIENTSDGIVRIDTITFTDNHFYIEREFPIVIDPYSNNLDSLVFSFRPDTIKNFNGQAEFSDNNPINTKISLTGAGQAPIIYTIIDSLRFGNVPVGSDSVQQIVIGNTGTAALVLDSLRITPSGENFSIVDTGIPFTIQPEKTDTINILFSPDSSLSYSETLLIYNNDPFADKNPYRIPVAGTGVKPVVQISADSIDFGEVILSVSDTFNIDMSNKGNAELVIGNGVNLEPGTLDTTTYILLNSPAGKSIPAGEDSLVSFQIIFTPSEKGSASARLTIPTNDSENPAFQIPLTGIGVLPIIDQPDSIFFGDIALKEDSVITFALSNIGDGTLTIDSVYVSIEDTAIFKIVGRQGPDSLRYAGDPLLIDVGFAPVNTGMTRAWIYIETNLPGNAGLDSFRVSGTGVKPAIAFSKDPVRFNLTYIGDQAADTVYIRNTGSGSLKIEEIIFTSDTAFADFSFNLSDSSISNSDFAALSITFQPSALENPVRKAAIAIKSNAPDSPDTTLYLEGAAKSPVIITVAAELDFEATFIDTDLEQLLSVRNDGDRALKISSITLKNSESPFSVYPKVGVEIPADSSRDLEVSFSPHVSGALSDSLFIISNDPIHDTVSVYLSGIGKTDPSPAGIAITEFPDTLVSGTDYTIQIDITGNEAPVKSCSLFVRPGGSAGYNRLLMNLVNGSSTAYETELPGSLISERGFEYYINVRHGGRNSYWPDSNAVDHPAYKQVYVSSINFPASTRSNEYQMFSLPLESGEQTLADLFEDILGSYNDTEYRIFYYSDSSYTELAGMDEPMPRGKALWLITRSSKDLAVKDVTSPDTPDAFTVHLKRGWNMIGVPFPFPVSTDQIDLSPISGGVFYNWLGKQWDNNIEILMPYDGYAVYALSEGPLVIPAVAADAAALSKPVQKPHARNDWQIRIDARRGPFSDLNNLAGVMDQAANGFDRFDLPEPPTPGNYVSLYFKNPETPLTADLRAPSDTAAGFQFDFSVISNFAGTTTLSFDDTELPSGYHYCVVSDETGVRYDDPRDIEVSVSRQDFILYIGEPSFIEKATAAYQMLPVAYALHQNYPNPFNPETRIKYALPVAGKVDLVVYDILGRVVKKLQTGIFREAGYHTIVWDGTNDHGQSAASGIYFLALRTSAYQHTIKMLLQR